MSTHIITATDASRSFSTILNKVHYLGESYEIKRGKEIIARIIPAEHKRTSLKVSEITEVYKRIPHLEASDQEAFVNDVDQIRSQMKIEDEGKLWE